jgi:methyltransferase (TIGR00027 family)
MWFGRRAAKSIGDVSISDTAHWVAVYRAWETARPDAIFHDPYASRLAGPVGEAIVRALPRGRSLAWAMIVRTAVFDEIILRVIGEQRADVVLNLAAGLDARPYRLPLPPQLRWIEVDLPPLLADKAAKLAADVPRCLLERVPLDLADVAARRELFARVGREAQRVLVVTEGLLVYLPAHEVTSLSNDLRARPSFRWWLTDIASRGVLRLMQRSWQPSLSTNTRMQFAPEDGEGFFERLGWRVVEFRLNLAEAHRLRREMRGAWLFRRLARRDARLPREKAQWRTGYLLLENAGYPTP